MTDDQIKEALAMAYEKAGEFKWAAEVREGKFLHRKVMAGIVAMVREITTSKIT